jgi:Bacterial Ig domain/FG-GAP-like repeat
MIIEAPPTPALLEPSNVTSPRSRVKDKRAVALRALSVLCLAGLCAGAGGSSRTVTLILGTRVELGPLQGVPTNLGYTPVNGIIADVNGDGLSDIVIGVDGSPPVVYLNNGTSNPFQNVPGVFIEPPPGPTDPGIGWGAVTLADVNADGHPDLAIVGFNSPNRVYLNNGTSNPFAGVIGIPIGSQDTSFGLAIGDVNGDGFADMVVANTNHIPSRLYLTNGAPLTSGAYSTIQVGSDIGYGQSAVIADIDGDGKPDLILTYTLAGVLTDPSGIAIYINNGTSNPFNNVIPTRLLVGQSVDAVAVADLNGDGKTDLVAAVSDSSLTQNDLYVYLNSGSSSAPFNDSTTLQTDAHLGGGCISIAVRDLNGDGLPDLLFGCTPPLSNAMPPPTNPAVGAIYLNNGTASPFAGVAPVDIPAAPESSYARGVDAGVLIKDHAPSVLVVDNALVSGGQSGAAAYLTTNLDQNPTAQNDTVVVAINKSIQVNVLANDTAASGDTLDATSVVITTTAVHGTATVNSTTGAINYQPATDYSGADNFQYMVRDNFGAPSNAASVSISVQPAPVATNDTATVQANSSIMIAVLGNDTSAGGTLDPASVKIVVAPTNGTATLSAGQVTYTPAKGYTGLDTFQYSVQDNLGTTSNVATVSVNVTAPPPSKGGGGSLSWLGILALAAMTLWARVFRSKQDPAIVTRG